MKILYSAMGSSLQLFLRIHRGIAENTEVSSPAFFVSNSENYQTALKSFPELASCAVLPEWQIVNEGKSRIADLKRIEEYEEQFGPLWNALLADRRVIFGKLSKFKQDYDTPFTHEQLLGILQSHIEHIVAFLDEVRPDVVVNFSPVTVGDYLFEVIAKKRNIPFFQLKSTKINNFIKLMDAGIDIPQALKDRCVSSSPFTDQQKSIAEETIGKTKQQGMKYEGVIAYGPDMLLRQLKGAPGDLARAVKKAIVYQQSSVLGSDNHLPPPVRSAFCSSVLQPIRTFTLFKSLKFVHPDTLSHVGPYIFFPLHFEPEVMVQVFGRRYQNQIEVIRNLALSAPAGMKIVVKEHPRSLGMRPISYYRKLLAIPNVILVHPFSSAISIIKHASMVSVISGSVGFEALAAEKPVLIFGVSPLALLPQSMVRSVRCLNNLAETIQDLLGDYSYDHDALVRYVCANINGAVPIDLYSVLLQKNKRESGLSNEKLREVEKEQLNQLVQHFIDTLACNSATKGRHVSSS